MRSVVGLAALLNPKTFAFIQKFYPYTGSLNLETPGDSAKASLPCGDVSDPFQVVLAVVSLMFFLSDDIGCLPNQALGLQGHIAGHGSLASCVQWTVDSRQR